MRQRTTTILLNIEPDLVDRMDEIVPKDEEIQGLPRSPRKRNRSAFIRQAIRDRVEKVEERLSKKEVA